MDCVQHDVYVYSKKLFTHNFLLIFFLPRQNRNKRILSSLRKVGWQGVGGGEVGRERRSKGWRKTYTYTDQCMY